MNSGLPRPRRSAFTLIELLVVISIIAVLLALGAPSVLNSIRASRLTGAGEKLLGSLSEAQQNAFTLNQPIEVRFYKFQGTFKDDDQHFRGYQFFRVSTASQATDGKRPGDEILKKFGPYYRLPENVMISSDPALSPILDGEGTKDEEQNAGVADATYMAIRFLTDGTCRRVGGQGTAIATLSFQDLPNSYLTVVEDDGKKYTGTEPPKNFYTVQTDPFTGKSRAYRPGF